MEREQKVNLEEEFSKLDDIGVTNSIITGDLFKMGESGIQLIENRIEQIKNRGEKNAALFRLSRLYTEVNHDFDKAMDVVERIKNKDEMVRATVAVAIALLHHTSDVQRADALIEKITEDKYNYIKNYNKEKELLFKK